MQPEDRDRIVDILLVEEDEVDVMNVRRALGKNNIVNPLYVAANGADALDSLRNGRVTPTRRMVTFTNFVGLMAALNRYRTLVELP